MLNKLLWAFSFSIILNSISSSPGHAMQADEDEEATVYDIITPATIAHLKNTTLSDKKSSEKRKIIRKGLEDPIKKWFHFKKDKPLKPKQLDGDSVEFGKVYSYSNLRGRHSSYYYNFECDTFRQLLGYAVSDGGHFKMFQSIGKTYGEIYGFIWEAEEKNSPIADVSYGIEYALNRFSPPLGKAFKEKGSNPEVLSEILAKLQPTSTPNTGDLALYKTTHPNWSPKGGIRANTFSMGGIIVKENDGILIQSCMLLESVLPTKKTHNVITKTPLFGVPDFVGDTVYFYTEPQPLQ